jgi:hypothetical protein
MITCHLGLAEVTPNLLPQKYNGFGLPNTKFKKVSLPPQTAKPAIPMTAISESKLTEKKEEKFIKLSLSLSPSYGLQSEKQIDGTQAQYLFYEADPEVKIGDYSLIGNFFFYQNLANASDNEWADSIIYFTQKPWALGPYFQLNPTITYGFPFSKKSREDARITSTLGSGLVLKLNTKDTNYSSLGLSYGLAYTKMFTSSEINSKSEPNVNYRLRQRLTLKYSLTEKFSILTRFQFDSSIALDDFVTNSFLHFQEIDYQIVDYLGVFIGHTNSNGLYNPETYQNNLKLYDNKSSEYYLGFTLTINNN